MHPARDRSPGRQGVRRLSVGAEARPAFDQAEETAASRLMRIGFAGTPAFAAIGLKAILEAGYPVAIVLTQPDRPRGRGMKTEPGPVAALARERGLSLLQPRSLKTAEDRAPLTALSLDVMVVAAYGLILPPQLLDWPKHGCINIHASLLPRWRGAAPIQRALLAGDAETGISIMRLDAGIDTGPVLLERRLPIGMHDTAGDLHDSLGELGAAALIEAIDGLAAGTITARAQPAEGATYAPKIEKSEARIDWNAGAAEIDRRVRAFNPWPIAETQFAGEPLKLLRAQLA